MRLYNVYTAAEIRGWSNDTPQKSGGSWIPARPIILWKFWSRLTMAWRVFIGRYDALDWEDRD